MAIIPNGGLTDPSDEYPNQSFFVWDAVKNGEDQYMSIEDMTKRCRYSTDSRDISALGRMWKNTTQSYAGVKTSQFIETGDDILVMVHKTIKDEDGKDKVNAEGKKIWVKSLRWVNHKLVDIKVNTKYSLGTGIKVDMSKGSDGMTHKWAKVGLRALYHRLVGYLAEEWNKESHGDSRSIYFPGNPKNRESFFISVKRIREGTIPGLYVDTVDGEEIIKVARSMYKMSDYFHKLFGVYARLFSTRALLIREQLTGDHAALGLVAGNFIALDDESDRQTDLHPIYRVCDELRWKDTKGITRVKSSYRNKDGSWTEHWYNTKDFVETYADDPYICRNVFHRNNADMDRVFEKVHLPYIHKDLEFCRPSVKGKTGYMLIFRSKRNPGMKVIISEKGVNSATLKLASFMSKISLPGLSVAAEKKTRKLISGCEFIFNSGSNTKFEDFRVIKAGITVNLNGETVKADIIEGDWYSPYPGEFHSDISGSSLITIRMYTDQAFFSKEGAEGGSWLGKPTRSRLTEYLKPIGPEVTLDDFNLHGLSSAAVIDGLKALEESWLTIDYERVYIGEGDLITGGDSCITSSLAAGLMAASHGLTDELAISIIRTFHNRVHKLLAPNGKNPAFISKKVANLTMLTIDAERLTIPEKYKKCQNFIVLPASRREEIRAKFPRCYEAKTVSISRPPKLTLDNGQAVHLFFTDEVGLEDYFNGIEFFDINTFVCYIPYGLMSALNADSDGDRVKIYFNGIEGFNGTLQNDGLKAFYGKRPIHLDEVASSIEGKIVEHEVYDLYTALVNSGKQAYAAEAIGLLTNALSRHVHTLMLKADAKNFKDNLMSIGKVAADTQEKTTKYKTEKALAWIALSWVYYDPYQDAKEDPFEDFPEISEALQFLKEGVVPQGMRIVDYIGDLVFRLYNSERFDIAQYYLTMLDISMDVLA